MAAVVAAFIVLAMLTIGASILYASNNPTSNIAVFWSGYFPSLIQKQDEDTQDTEDSQDTEDTQTPSTSNTSSTSNNVDCVGAWGPYSGCTATSASGGIRTFKISTPASGSGKACDFVDGTVQYFVADSLVSGWNPDCSNLSCITGYALDSSSKMCTFSCASRAPDPSKNVKSWTVNPANPQSCIAASCIDSSYIIQNGQCVKDPNTACTNLALTEGVLGWGGSPGACVPTSCDNAKGYYLQNGQCVKLASCDQKPADPSKFVQSWTGSNPLSCTALTCATPTADSHVAAYAPSGGACVISRCTDPYGFSDGQCSLAKMGSDGTVQLPIYDNAGQNRINFVNGDLVVVNGSGVVSWRAGITGGTTLKIDTTTNKSIPFLIAQDVNGKLLWANPMAVGSGAPYKVYLGTSLSVLDASLNAVYNAPSSATTLTFNPNPSARGQPGYGMPYYLVTDVDQRLLYNPLSSYDSKWGNNAQTLGSSKISYLLPAGHRLLLKYLGYGAVENSVAIDTWGSPTNTMNGFDVSWSFSKMLGSNERSETAKIFTILTKTDGPVTVSTTCPTGQQKINGVCYPTSKGWFSNTVDLKGKFGIGSKSLEDCFNASDKPANADLILYRAVNGPDWVNTCAAWTLDGIKSGVYGNEGGLNTQFMACANKKDPKAKCI